MFYHPTIGTFVLFEVLPIGSGRSLLFLPETDAPGFSIDLLRIDLIPAADMSIEQLANAALQQQQAAGTDCFSACTLSHVRDQLLFHLQTRHHPVFGDQDVLVRLARQGLWLIGTQLIHKLDGLSPDQIAERAAFLSVLELKADSLIELDTMHTPFVQNAMKATQALRDLATTMKPDMDLSGIPALLARASPFHDQFNWASFAVLAAGEIIDQGEVATFDATLRMLGLAALYFSDLLPKEKPAPMRRLELQCFDHLATLLLYTLQHAPRHQTARAAGLWQICATQGPGVDFGPAADCATKAAFAAALTNMEVNGPLDVDLDDAIQAVRASDHALGSAIDTLSALSNNLTHAGRLTQGGHAQLFAACIGCDLAQILAESAITKENLRLDANQDQSIFARITLIFKAQLDAQFALYGITEPQWKQMMQEGAAMRVRHSEAPSQAVRHLFFMRPLCTSRRIVVPNRFQPPTRHKMAFSLLPNQISIEAALHWALHSSFKTEALGGPIDIFGMRRGTLLDSNPDGWRMYAAIQIDAADILCVLPAQTEGLAWELKRVIEIGARQRLLFVLPPADGANGMMITDRAITHLEALGFRLPADAGPGFVMFSPDGTADMLLPFETLWDDTLRQAVLTRIDWPSVPN